ncbi:MAG: glycosyltransferase [Planctomycetota bacterium]|nr:MAG: glycosyltransferase [Planctomycetota bacterium]
MERSLSVLLVVRNCQRTLAQDVAALTEVLPDLTDRWEVILVDDGSTDATCEIVDELSHEYPQVRCFRYREQRGRVEAIRAALSRSRGKIVCIPDPRRPLSPSVLFRMWKATEEYDVVLAGIPKQARRTGVAGFGYAMIYRRAIDPLMPYLGSLDRLPAALERLGYSWCDVEATCAATQVGEPIKRPHMLARESRREMSLGGRRSESMR